MRRMIYQMLDCLLRKFPRAIYGTTIFLLQTFLPRRILLYASFFYRSAVCEDASRLDGKTVLITGANSGIGSATAEDMAKRGARVIMACRDMFKAESVAFDIVERTGSKQVVIQHLDLSSFESIRKCVDRIKYEEKRLDILINNAGVAMCPEGKTSDGLEFHFGINHMGHFLLTMMLMDLLKSSTPSRIINISDDGNKYSGKFDFENLGTRRHYNSKTAYGQSKLANILFTKELARRLTGTGVVCMSVYPGVVRTDIYREAAWWVRYLVYLISPIFKSCAQGAQTSIHCALLEPSADMFAGKSMHYSECAPDELSWLSVNEEDAKRLWNWSTRFAHDSGVSIEEVS